MDAGSLRNRVTIQSQAAGKDSYGAASGSWVDVATVWAAVQPLRGGERFAASQVKASVDTKIIMRYRAGLDPKMRLVYGSDIYDVEAVIDVNSRHEMLEVICKRAA